MLEKTERTIKNEQSKDTGNIVHKTLSHMTKTNKTRIIHRKLNTSKGSSQNVTVFFKRS